MPLIHPREPQITIRKPITRQMLVHLDGEWQVCYQAKGNINGRRVTAWVYGRESAFFCEVGSGERAFDLPDIDRKPFFDDSYIFTIEDMNRDGSRFEKLAGANNIIAINATWQVLTSLKRTRLRLREGATVIRDQDPAESNGETK